MPVKNINSRCSGYTVSSGNICECCIWRLKISENIEYSSYRELSSKGEGIIFIECLLAVGTLVSPCMIDDIAVGGAHNGMGYLPIRIVLHSVCHMSAYRTLNPALIKRDINVHSILSVGDEEILNVSLSRLKNFSRSLSEMSALGVSFLATSLSAEELLLVFMYSTAPFFFIMKEYQQKELYYIKVM